MCCGALIQCRISKIYYLVNNDKFGSITSVEKILDKLMKQIVNDDLDDVIANYTGYVIRTTKGKYKVIQHKGDDFWISIPKGRE